MEVAIHELWGALKGGEGRHVKPGGIENGIAADVVEAEGQPGGQPVGIMEV